MWLEGVGATYVPEFSLTPDLDGARLLIQASMNGPSKDVKLRFRAFAEGQPVGEETVSAAWRSTLAVWIRRAFRLETRPSGLTALQLHHDEDAEIYLNGQRVAALTGYATDYSLVLNDTVAKSLVAGNDVLAAHCHNTVGGQFIDVGIEVGTEPDGPTGR